jgi:hypothetical protein
VGVPSYGRLWSQRGWLVGNWVGCISVTNPEAHFEGPRRTVCSRKSGGGGRHLGSIFEAEGAERAKIGSGAAGEAHSP